MTISKICQQFCFLKYLQGIVIYIYFYSDLESFYKKKRNPKICERINRPSYQHFHHFRHQISPFRTDFESADQHDKLCLGCTNITTCSDIPH